MAAGVLSEPGTEHGPCAEHCYHPDCRRVRRFAETGCRICTKPIGYDRRFYSEAPWLVHEVCLEAEVEAGR